MRAAPSTWPARSRSGCLVSSGCFSWGLMSTRLTKTVCVPHAAPPAPAGSPHGWAGVGHGVWALPSFCCKHALFIGWFGSWVQAAEPPWCFVFPPCCCLCQVQKGAETSSMQAMADGKGLCLHSPVVPMWHLCPLGPLPVLQVWPVPTPVPHHRISGTLPEGEALSLP